MRIRTWIRILHADSDLVNFVKNYVDLTAACLDNAVEVLSDGGGGEGGGRNPGDGGVAHLPRVKAGGDHLHLGAVVEDGPQLRLVDGHEVGLTAQTEKVFLIIFLGEIIQPN